MPKRSNDLNSDEYTKRKMRKLEKKLCKRQQKADFASPAPSLPEEWREELIRPGINFPEDAGDAVIPIDIMMKPPPDNLAQRQIALNNKVKDAAGQNIDFSKVQDEVENTELDMFFKIDLAAKFGNVDYIIEVLKAGVTLYAHRALKKCQWLYDDEHAYIINPEYLHNTIFPVTSIKVKRLILKTVAMRVRTEERAAAFYQYCIKTKMTDIAFKCLLFTSEEFKLFLMQNHNEPPFDKIVTKKHNYIRFIIGKSFPLLKAYMKMLKTNQSYTIRKFRYLYPVNNIAYLELLEQYVDPGSWSSSEFDLKLSDDIMKKYKERVLRKPLFYLKKVNSDIIIRNSTVEDAKIYAAALLPSDAEEFWTYHYYDSQKKYFDLIPRSDLYKFIKEIYADKYPGEEFETKPEFYYFSYYKFMTMNEREEWALNHIKSDKQILGVGRDYIWYKFVRFENAFEDVKQFIIVTKEPEKRNDMIEILIESARNNRNLENLFNFYQRRHVNELRSYKESFLNKVITHHNVFEFDDPCWAEFFNLLLSMELYNTLDYKDCNYDYKTVTLFYYILNQKQLSDELMVFLLNDFYPNSDKISQHLRKLTEEKRLILYNYLYDFYINEVNLSKNRPHTKAGQSKVDRYFQIVLLLMSLFNKHSQEEEVKKRVHTQKQRKTHRANPGLSDRTLLRLLKKDKNLVISKVPDLESRILRNETLPMSNFLRKIKIYFPNDIREDFLALYKELVTKDLDMNAVNACVQGIFELGDESTKVKFMNSYTPEVSKIDYNNVEAPKLRIQKAICRFASKSVPPVPLSIMLRYLQGDYMQHCLHIFSIYIAVFPITVCVNFVESLLDTPVSSQKHALRLAFQCFDAENLKKISISIWKKTKNVSLRSVLYMATFNRIAEKAESELYDVLILFTLDLHDDDDKGIFDIIVSDSLPENFLGRFIEACWKAIKTFKDKEPNIQRKISVTKMMICKSYLLEENFFGSVIDEHLHKMFVENNLEFVYSNDDISKLYSEQWALTAEYIFTLTDKNENPIKYVDLAQNIVQSCLKMWDNTSSGFYIHQLCFWDFIRKLNEISLHYYTISANLIPIYEGILNVVVRSLRLYEFYLIRWELQVAIANRQVMKKRRGSWKKDNDCELFNESAFAFGSDLSKLISEYVEKKEFIVSSTEKMAEVTYKSLEDLLENLQYLDGERDTMIKSALIHLSLGLLERETPESYLLAVQLLPDQDVERYDDKLQLVVDKIWKCPNLEVQHAVRLKFQKYCK